MKVIVDSVSVTTKQAPRVMTRRRSWMRVDCPFCHNFIPNPVDGDHTCRCGKSIQIITEWKESPYGGLAN